jgi:hypothetical protein
VTRDKNTENEGKGDQAKSNLKDAVRRSKTPSNNKRPASARFGGTTVRSELEVPTGCQTVGPPPKRDGGPTVRCCGLPECVDLVGSLDHLAILPAASRQLVRTMATADH